MIEKALQQHQKALQKNLTGAKTIDVSLI